ncbi:MAG TPA: YxlC family protein [Symbiobacteriaceae bacterium]|jgi:hypothetical protein
MKPDGKSDWEAQLRAGLDAISDLNGEEPPRLETLQMLAVEVQREQRRETLRDLVRFWAVAVVILAGVLYPMSRQPVWFFIAQGVGLVGLLVSAAIFGRKRVTE